MTTRWGKTRCRWGCGFVALALALVAEAQLRYEATSAYHHLRVMDEQNFRTLYFDNAMESRMSLTNPLLGHFEYTEYFHMPWLWNDEIKTVLLIGLGGGSVPRAFAHCYTNVALDVVELDPKVVQVARHFFGVPESPNLKIVVEDGRVYLRRSEQKYDVILMDAYTANRYGAFIPYSLATKEFFTLVADHLTDQGVTAYNVVGTIQRTAQENIVGAMHRTLRAVFPQVYLFPALSSRNVVLLATKSPKPVTLAELNQKATALATKPRTTLVNYTTRLRSLRFAPPPAAADAQVLTDDFAPVDGLLQVEW